MSETGMEWARGRIAQLEADYTGACEAIRQLEANVAEARAEVERTNHVMRLERMARQDSEDRLKARATAAEAAREAVLASLAAAEAVAGEVRGEAAKAVCHYCRVGAPFVETPYVRNGRWHQNDVDPLVCSWCSASAIHAIPTPSAALQRVREQAVADFLARCEPKPSEESVKKIVASMFPTPDAGGPT